MGNKKNIPEYNRFFIFTDENKGLGVEICCHKDFNISLKDAYLNLETDLLLIKYIDPFGRLTDSVVLCENGWGGISIVKMEAENE